MKVFENRTFECFDDRNSGAVFEDLEFRKCHFQSCRISIPFSSRRISSAKMVERRSTIRNVKLINCTHLNSKLWTPIVEDVVVDGFRSKGSDCEACCPAFKHVVLKGRFDMFWMTGVARFDDPKVQEAFRRANAEYYRSVDWALDISQAEFKEAEIEGVPGRLIRRDPET